MTREIGGVAVVTLGLRAGRVLRRRYAGLTPSIAAFSAVALVAVRAGRHGVCGSVPGRRTGGPGDC